MGRSHDFFCCGGLYSPLVMPACPCCGAGGFYDPEGVLLGIYEAALRRGRSALAARIDNLASRGEDEELASLIDRLVADKSMAA